jgi:hypothetical protein
MGGVGVFGTGVAVIVGKEVARDTEMQYRAGVNSVQR